ncbi:MAG: GIY-YIG nuclease family protein [Candidatus Levybacteria bacterium]|nr:GIY-YIG nuclease family protein [Candidatus Levybacteria bacterium]
MYYLYILKNQTGKYYIGSTINVSERLKRHNSGGSNWTSKYKPWDLVYIEEFGTKSEAIKREKVVKSYKGGNAFFKLIK